MSTATDTPTPATTTGPCTGCGTIVEREVARGLGANWFNDRPLTCGACAAQQEAESREEDQRQREVMRAERRAVQYRACLEKSDVPADMRGKPFADLERDAGNALALDAASRWAAGDLKGLVLIGEFGVGKTSIAAAAAMSFLRTPKALRWLKVHQLMGRLSRGFGDPVRNAALDSIDGTAALVLDDLDKTRPTEYGAEPLFSAIDDCVSEGRPLIVTTNLPIPDLAARWPEPFGQGIATRLVGYCEVHVVTGPDRRLAKAA